MLGFNHFGKLGQLGNQMFQYAALRGIANKTGTNFMIPDHREIFDDGIGNKYTILLFDVFNLKNASYKGMLNTVHYVQESHFHFDEEMFDLSKKENYSLYGFFQTEKYFKHIEDSIRIDFSFKDEIKNYCEPLRKQFKDPIALHIRRGDFLINHKFHPPLELNYYEEALKEFDSNRDVIIFSDDTDWCKEQKIFEDDRFAVAEGGNQFYDMCLMTMCDDFIIANSTFSWWGAWLGNRGKVIAPKTWFGEGLKHDTKDLYCENWIKL